MAIIIPPSQPVFTTEQLQAQVHAQMTALINQGYRNFHNLFITLFNSVWSSPVKLTPQQVVDSFKTDGGQLFELALDIQNLLNKYVPNSVSQIPPNVVNINNDGTVTIGAAIPPV